MLKKRLICCLILKDQLLVQSIGFSRYLPIGRAKIAVEFMTNWDIDEIVILDITAAREGRKPNTELIGHVSQKCFVPLTVGGGIACLADVHKVIRAGADKISINRAALSNPGLVSTIAESFGTQCVVVSIDAKRKADGSYEVLADSGRTPTGLSALEWARRVESLGAGEILLNSIDRDGSKLGYDLELVQMVSDGVGIPVIACGGVGIAQHFADGLTQTKASAAAAANFFQHLEHSTIVAKSYLQKAGIDIRLSTLARYTDFVFDDSGRILKKADAELDQMWIDLSSMETI